MYYSGRIIYRLRESCSLQQQDKQAIPDATVGESPFIQNFFSAPRNEDSVFVS